MVQGESERYLGEAEVTRSASCSKKESRWASGFLAISRGGLSAQVDLWLEEPLQRDEHDEQGLNGEEARRLGQVIHREALRVGDGGDTQNQGRAGPAVDDDQGLRTLL